MADHIPLIDAQLANARPLQVRIVEPRVFKPLVDHVASSVTNTGAPVVEPDEQRDVLLARYRRLFTEQVVHDVSYNVQHLWHWAEQLARNTNVFHDVLIQRAFQHLSAHRNYLIERDQWSSNRAEQECWMAFHEFYCGALFLADRLFKFESTNITARSRTPRPRRPGLPDFATDRLAQICANIAEQVVPNFIHLRPLRSMAPVLGYMASRLLCPWLTFKWSACIGHFRYLITAGGFAGWAGRQAGGINCRRADEIFGNSEFFDRHGHGTKHNIIFAFSHRHAVLDLSLLGEVFARVRHAIWANDEFLPRSAARDPHVIMVRPGKKRNLDAMLAKSARLLLEERLPLLIAVDGGGPYLPYGQQMRMKRGVRLLLDHLEKNTRDSRRKTYIVPISLNDTLSFVRGLDREVTVTFHDPISVDEIAPRPRAAESTRVNYGDPLLNHLECFFLMHTAQVRHGWRTPCVIETVRQVNAELGKDRTMRGKVRRQFHASIFDMCRAHGA